MDKTISIGQLVTLLTAAGVAIYVLGLIGIAVSIYFTFAKTWSTAWYAVSLMPRTVVAGQGVRIWRQSWVLAVAPLVIFSSYFFIANAIERLLITFTDLPYRHATTYGPLVVLLVLFIVLAPLREPLHRLWLRHRGSASSVSERSAYETSKPPPVRYMLPWTIGIPLYVFGFGISIVGSYIVVTNITPVNWNSITVGVLLFLVGALSIAIRSTRGMEQPLPPVLLLERGEASLKRGQPYATGWLVAHSDGYWHLFNNRHVLVSVPDDRVNEARVDDPRIPEQLRDPYLEAKLRSTEETEEQQ
jgi:hypothetical protein